jgi:hypothetical protein
MRKNAIINEALDKLNEVQQQHPLISTGVLMGANLLGPIGRGLSTAVTAGNIANTLRAGQPISATGQIVSSALPYTKVNPMLGMGIGMGAQMGGDFLQNKYNAAHAEPRFEHAASRGGTRMSRQNIKLAAFPLVAAALPLLKSMGTQAVIGAGMTGLSNAMNKQPITEGMGSAAAMGGASGAMFHGAGKLMGGGAPAAKPDVPPEVTPKVAFYYNMKAAQQRINFAAGRVNTTGGFHEQHSPKNREKQSMYHPNPVALALMQRMNLIKLALEFPDPSVAASLHPGGFIGPPELGSTPAEKWTASAKSMKDNPFYDKPEYADQKEPGMLKKLFGGGADTPTGVHEDPEIGSSLGDKLEGFGNSSIGRSLGRHGTSTGLRALGGAGIGALGGGLAGAALGDVGGGLGAGIGAGAGAGLGSGAGDILATLLRLKGVNGGPGMAQALRYGGGALGGAAGGGLGYMVGKKDHEKESSYQPRLLLSGLTNAVRAGGRRMLPESFPTWTR